MIIIDQVLVSDQVIEEQFVCDLTKCKGGCCEDGDAGAPLDNQEKEYVKAFYEIVKPYMTKQGIKEVETVGPYLYDREFGWVTPTINGGICAYGYKDEKNINLVLFLVLENIKVLKKLHKLLKLQKSTL